MSNCYCTEYWETKDMQHVAENDQTGSPIMHLRNYEASTYGQIPLQQTGTSTQGLVFR